MRHRFPTSCLQSALLLPVLLLPALLLTALLLSVLPAGGAAAQEAPKPPPTFAIAGPGSYGLGDALVLELRLGRGVTIDPRRITLLLDGEPAGLVPQWAPPHLTFRLQRIDSQGTAAGNRALWERLLAEPYARQRSVAVALRNGDEAIAFAAKPEDSPAAATGITLVKYDGWQMAGGLLLVVLAVGGVIWFGRSSGMLRDAPVPQMPVAERSFSLGRCQMAVWFCLILTSFLLIAITLQDLNSITTQSFILLGVSAGTGLASVAIDNSRTEARAAIDALAALGLKTPEDVAALYSRAAAEPGDAGARGLLETYRQTVAPYRSGGFWLDLLTDAGGVTLHRFQIVIWTVVLGAIYAVQVYTRLKPPDFGDNLLILMGITSGIYLGFKPAEKHG
ncbi:hypothetical protein [Ferrovibrio sp.]|uniref:hypothetical protein n=1 Tax=Ferrovibrio sp. TaxID=1917215 RepID=UPI0035171174